MSRIGHKRKRLTDDGIQVKKQEQTLEVLADALTGLSLDVCKMVWLFDGRFPTLHSILDCLQEPARQYHKQLLGALPNYPDQRTQLKLPTVHLQLTRHLSVWGVKYTGGGAIMGQNFLKYDEIADNFETELKTPTLLPNKPLEKFLTLHAGQDLFIEVHANTYKKPRLGVRFEHHPDGMHNFVNYSFRIVLSSSSGEHMSIPVTMLFYPDVKGAIDPTYMYMAFLIAFWDRFADNIAAIGICGGRVWDNV